MQFSGPSLTAEAPPADGMEMGPRGAPAAPDDGQENFDHFISPAPRSRGPEGQDSSSPAGADSPDQPGNSAPSGRRSGKAADGPPDSAPVAASPDQPEAPAVATDSASRDPSRRRRSASDAPVPPAVASPVPSAAGAAVPVDPTAPSPSAFLVGAWTQGSAELLSSSLAPAVRNAAVPDEGGVPAATNSLPDVPGPGVAAFSAAAAGQPVPTTPTASASSVADSAGNPVAAPADAALPLNALEATPGAPQPARGRGPARSPAADRSRSDEPAPAAGAPANPAAAPAVTAATMTSAPTPTPAGARPGASAEKFAAPAPLGPEALKPIVSDLQKKLLTPDDEKAARPTPAVGTAGANPGPAMTTSSFLHAATFIQGFVDRVGSAQAAQTPAGFSSSSVPAAATAAPVTIPGASEAVAAVMKLIQAQANQSQGGVSAVNLSFKFGDDNLSVRVAWRDGIVQTQFRTDSDELRAALAGEWQTMAAAPASRALPLATPVFSSSSDSASGDESRQSAQSGFGREWGQSDGGSASAPLVPSGPVSPRRPPPLVAAGRLHAFA